jgi:hypothetical protein
MAEFQQAGRPVVQDSRDGYPPLKKNATSRKKILRPAKKKCFSVF